MSVNMTAPSVRGWPDLDDPVIAYAEWRTACIAVWKAYRDWTKAPKADRALAYAAYGAALDREDAAASTYSQLLLGTSGPADGLIGLDAA
jgi:hypothetical protein